jgi:uncharacterized membrane protein (DUF485 family)
MSKSQQTTKDAPDFNRVWRGRGLVVLKRKKMKAETILNIVSIVLFIGSVLLIAFIKEIEIELRVLAIGVISSVILGVHNMFMSFLSGEKRDKALKNVDEANKTNKNMAEASLRLQIKEPFDTDEMKDGKKKLADFARRPDFANVFAGMLAKNDPEAKVLDLARGRYSHAFYNRIFILLPNVSDEFIKTTVALDEVLFLLDVIQPMEKAKNPDYDTKMFDMFRKMYEKELEER